MSEEKERVESGGENTIAGVDPIAVALALGGASREDANAFLQKQASLIDLQKHHLHEQFKHLHLGIWEKQIGVVLRVATMIMGLAVAGSLGFMVWQASQSNGLLVEPFSVPPDMASRGLTGEVVASRVLDRLSLMQSQTNTGRPARSYANAWGEHGMKMEIPETGISLNELDNWLRQKLGHDIRVTGEIVRTATGVTITARAGDEGAETVSGPDGDVDVMVKQLAESIYRLTQPYRYGMFLVTNGRGPEALPIFKALATTGNKEDRLWAYNRWATSIGNRDGLDAAIGMFKQGLAIDPEAIGIYDNFGGALTTKGRQEEALQINRAQLAHLLDGKQTYVPAERIPTFKRMVQAKIAQAVGGYHEATETWTEVKRTGYPGFNVFNLTAPILQNRMGEHDPAGAREALADFDEAGGRQFNNTVLTARMQLAQHAEDWRGMAALVDAAAPDIRKRPLLVLTGAVTPMTAYSDARLGRFAAAEAVIGPTAADCYPCLRVRARIAELRGDRRRADYWFSRATAEGPSLPFAEFEWGQAWLSRGQPDAAIEKFKLANQKGPHFADPIEMWGEALMAKNQSHLALEKFTEAEKYAPNWGRLHLKWGEALAYAGKPDDAKAQFARATALDLTPSEKSELAKISSRLNHV
jgi:tetratricopeptide (TPR) repeat protein